MRKYLGSVARRLVREQRGGRSGAVPIPAGVLLPYGGTTAPTGFLLCDGTSYLRTDYPALFAAIATAYGSADGTHFNVPDTRQRFVMGKAASGTGNALGATGGTIDHAHDAHAVTQPAAHVVTQPAAHSAHVVTQPAAHVVTQPAAHSAHVFTQPSQHASQGGHQHDDHSVTLTAHGQATGTDFVTTAATKTFSAHNGVHATGGAHQHDTHSGGAVDAHSPHTSTAVDAHSATAVDAHSPHSATAVDAHSGAAVAPHAAANAPFVVVNHIIKV